VEQWLNREYSGVLSPILSDSYGKWSKKVPDKSNYRAQMINLGQNEVKELLERANFKLKQERQKQLRQ
jgi:hypothetical protein